MIIVPFEVKGWDLDTLTSTSDWMQATPRDGTYPWVRWLCSAEGIPGGRFCGELSVANTPDGHWDRKHLGPEGKPGDKWHVHHRCPLQAGEGKIA